MIFFVGSLPRGVFLSCSYNTIYFGILSLCFLEFPVFSYIVCMFVNFHITFFVGSLTYPSLTYPFKRPYIALYSPFETPYVALYSFLKGPM